MQRNGCSGCHNEKAWEIVEFDHNTSSFPLLGKHSQVKCSECHRTASGIQLFSSLDTECQSCHADIHGGQFSKGGRTECQACHTPFDWKKTTFDHEKTGFPLTGAHRNVQCSECHRAESTEKGQIVIYKTGKTKCSDCH